MDFQDAENERSDSAQHPSNQPDLGKQGLGSLGTPIPVHTAVKVGWASLHAHPNTQFMGPLRGRAC